MKSISEMLGLGHSYEHLTTAFSRNGIQQGANSFICVITDLSKKLYQGTLHIFGWDPVPNFEPQSVNKISRRDLPAIDQFSQYHASHNEIQNKMEKILDDIAYRNAVLARDGFGTYEDQHLNLSGKLEIPNFKMEGEFIPGLELDQSNISSMYQVAAEIEDAMVETHGFPENFIDSYDYSEKYQNIVIVLDRLMREIIEEVEQLGELDEETKIEIYEELQEKEAVFESIKHDILLLKDQLEILDYDLQNLEVKIDDASQKDDPILMDLMLEKALLEGSISPEMIWCEEQIRILESFDKSKLDEESIARHDSELEDLRNQMSRLTESYTPKKNRIESEIKSLESILRVVRLIKEKAE